MGVISMERNERCNRETEVFSRIVGYYRPIKLWNDGKKEEFRERLTFSEKKALEDLGK
jgi:anaerobic ribonucleoside-triphosphate reductase